ncbi:MAG: hypothetical protein JXM79_11630 [Sedimentisphaerales bacterium]|nr:hypothetical protein [Sedimentisphaerales bacterium]
MDDRNHENLRELLATFFDAEQVDRLADDFQQAEQVFQTHPAHKPDDRLIANIKTEIALSLGRQRAKHFRRRLFEAAAGIAAAVAILVIVSLQFSEKSVKHPGNNAYTASLLPTALWESNDIAADDTDLAVFTAEIEQIEYEIHSLELGDDITENETSVTELEMELAEINVDFWKG